MSAQQCARARAPTPTHVDPPPSQHTTPTCTNAHKCVHKRPPLTSKLHQAEYPEQLGGQAGTWRPLKPTLAAAAAAAAAAELLAGEEAVEGAEASCTGKGACCVWRGTAKCSGALTHAGWVHGCSSMKGGQQMGGAASRQADALGGHS